MSNADLILKLVEMLVESEKKRMQLDTTYQSQHKED